MDVAKVDQLIQFALARAAHEDDPFERELGPIHLIKYVYLADLAFARRNGGTTYTGIEWQFFHFGPWSSVVNTRVGIAADDIGAVLRTLPANDATKEGKRYGLPTIDADAVQRKLERDLPIVVCSALKKAVHQFGADTPKLLDWVYKTPPMLRAVPNEALDFTTAVEAPSVPSPVPEEPSRRQEKKVQAWLENAQKVLAEKRAARGKVAERIRVAPDPIDEVTEQGMAWLNADTVVTPTQGETRFSEEVWRSGWRDPHGED